jgi:flagellar basal-body rod protein FlgC
MNYFSSFEISAAGMAFERLRADVSSANIANMHTTRSLNGMPYQPLRAVATTALAGPGFEHYMNGAARQFNPLQVSVEQMQVAPRMVHEPGHPHADAKGFVAYPNVNMVSEMVSLMTATRTYSANVAAVNAAKSLALKTLELGGNR